MVRFMLVLLFVLTVIPRGYASERDGYREFPEQTVEFLVVYDQYLNCFRLEWLRNQKLYLEGSVNEAAELADLKHACRLYRDDAFQKLLQVDIDTVKTASEIQADFDAYFIDGMSAVVMREMENYIYKEAGFSIDTAQEHASLLIQRIEDDIHIWEYGMAHPDFRNWRGILAELEKR